MSPQHQEPTLHDPITLRLALVPVNAECRPSVLSHLVGELVRLPLGLDEDEGLVLRLKEGGSMS